MVTKARDRQANGLLSLVSLVLITTQRVSSETTCDILPPMESKEGPEFGMVLVPGDTLVGETYRPLSIAIQGWEQVECFEYTEQGWGRYFENVSKIRYRYTKGLCLLYLQILQIQIPLNWLKIGQRDIQKI